MFTTLRIVVTITDDGVEAAVKVRLSHAAYLPNKKLTRHATVYTPVYLPSISCLSFVYLPSISRLSPHLDSKTVRHVSVDLLLDLSVFFLGLLQAYPARFHISFHTYLSGMPCRTGGRGWSFLWPLT